MSDLEAFLTEARQAGTLDSEGQFTLAVEKSRGKLRQYQLADPSFYLLKVVQAAVAVGAPGIDIRLRRDGVELSFGVINPVPPLGTAALLAALASDTSRSRATRHLAVGLNASLATARQVEWSVWSPEENCSLLFTGDQLELRRPEGQPLVTGGNSRFRLRVHRRASSSTAPEHTAVYRRCAYAGTMIGLDGRPLERWLRPPEPGDWHNQFSEPFPLIERYAGPGTLRVQPRRARKPSVLRPGLSINPPEYVGLFQGYPPFLLELAGVHDEGGELECSAAYSLRIGQEGPGGIILVKDGVALDPEPLEGLDGLGALAVVGGDDLQVDASEFRVVRDARYEALVERTQGVWPGLAGTVLSQLSLLRCRRGERNLGHVKLGLAVGLVLGPLGWIGAPLTLYLGLKKYDRWCDANLRELVARRLERALHPGF